jgi:hypothetical protein
MKVKMYGQKRLIKQPNNPRDLRYLKKQQQREKSLERYKTGNAKKEAAT